MTKTWKKFKSKFQKLHSNKLVPYQGGAVSVCGENLDEIVSNDLYYFNPNKEIEIQIKPKNKESLDGFKKRHHSSNIYKNLIISFGGDSYPDIYTNDVSVFNLDSFTWNLLEPTSKELPIARRYHSSEIYKDYLFVFGGETNNYSHLNDLWCLNLITREWKELNPNGTIPNARRYATLTLYENSLYLLFGRNNQNRFNDFWEYNIQSNAWKEVLPINNMPSPRAAHVSVLYNSSILCFGGNDGTPEFSNSLFEYNFVTKCWTEVQVQGKKPPGMYWHGGALTEDFQLIIYGGEITNDGINDSWYYINLKNSFLSKKSIQGTVYNSIDKYNDLIVKFK